VIGIVMASMLEAAPIVRMLGLKEIEADPFPVFGGDRLRLIVSGIGKANAAMACTYLIGAYGPHAICNLGAAGATDGRCGIGESFHVSLVIEPDRPDLRTDVPSCQTPDILPGFSVVTLATHDKPIRYPREREEIASSAHLVDMEGAAVVQACKRFSKKSFLFKFVSDTPDHEASSDIIGNIRLYREGFARFFADSALPEILLSVDGP
jgi:adenosylhomocysteine nucleosidase